MHSSGTDVVMVIEPSEVGIRKCQTCGRLFVSEDRERIRRCHRCKKAADDHSPRVARLLEVDAPVLGRGFLD